MKNIWCLICFGFIASYSLAFDWNYGQIDDVVLSFNDLADNDSIVYRNVKSSLRKKPRNFNEELCRSQLDSILQDAKNGEKWALKVIDSWGKQPSGILWGRMTDLGNYEECMHVAHDLGGNDNIFLAQYCIASYPLGNVISEKHYKNVRKLAEPSKPSNLSIGICVPDTCNITTLDELFKDLIFKRSNDTIEGDLFHELQCTRHEAITLEGLDIFAIVFFSLILVMLIVSTLYEIYAGKTKMPKNRLLMAFSVISNSKKLFRMKSNTSTDTRTIECLNGIRFISIVWVIFAHTYLMLFWMPATNYKHLWEWAQEYFAMTVLCGSNAVDTFFFLSGLLVTLSVYKELDKRGKLNIPIMYFHRYLRLFPIFGVTILFCVTFHKYIGDGPFWKLASIRVGPPCKLFWWSALLHIQNFVNPSAMCLSHTWYLSVDTQMYLLSPLILIPLRKWGNKFIIFILFVMLASTAYIFAIVIIKDFTIKALQQGLVGDSEKKMYLYYGLHTRAAPWLIGALLGHYIRKLKGEKIKIPFYVLAIGWFLCLTVMIAIVFGPYEAQQLLNVPTKLESALYDSLSRLSWSISLSWLIFACMQGYGGLINSILSFPIWQPLCRLSYTIYIIHLVVQTTVGGMVKTNITFTNLDAIRGFWSDFGLMLTISIPMVLAFESPIIALESYLLSPRKKTNSTISPVQLSGGLENGKEESKS